MQNQIINFLNKILTSKIIFFVALGIWAYFTLTDINMYKFFGDETWGWNIAANLNLFEIIKLMHYEGHTFLWFVILKPFTHFACFFPMALKVINWIFLFSALILFGKFSPINNIYKILTLFSLAFLTVYPTLGRPYGMGIFFLFLLIVLYKNRLNHPLMYAGLIFLACNTHLSICIGALAFGIIFTHELFKEKHPNKYLSLAIITSGIISLIIQWIPFHTPAYVNDYNKLLYLLIYFFNGQLSGFYKIITLISGLAFCITLFLPKKKYWTFWGIFVFVSLFAYYIFVYPAFLHHINMLFVYIIAYYWIIKEYDEKNNQIYSKILPITVGIILILSLPFHKPYVNRIFPFDINKKEFIEDFNEINRIIPEGSTVYIPYLNENTAFLLKKNNYKLMLNKDIPYNSFEAMRLLHMNILKTKYHYLKPEDIPVNGESVYFLTRYPNFKPEKNVCYTKNGKYLIINLTK